MDEHRDGMFDTDSSKRPKVSPEEELARQKELVNDLRDKMVELVELQKSTTAVPQSIFVIEECSELTKELTKWHRSMHNIYNTIDEACDVLASVGVLLGVLGVDEITILDKIEYKYTRAIERHTKTGRF